MNAKDLKADSALGGHINDGSTKYAQSGSSRHNNSNKLYQDIGPSAMGKVDVQTSRPCAIIGPDRVLPSQNCNDGYIKKTPAEPWPCLDNVYRQTSDYTHKLSEYQPTRNISPRQTFQENMQRIMVSPYSSVKKSDDPNLPVDRNVAMLKDVKLNIPIEAKYCEVPYTVNPACNEQKSVRVPDMRVSNVNPGATRSTPHAWPHNNINVRPLRPYAVPDLYQYSEYPSCTGPRPAPMVRPQRLVHDEPGRMYPEPYYQDANIRFRPYPPSKGRYPPGRYEYVSNYSNTFHPSPPFPPQAYDSQKPMPSHSYPLYPQPPLKYIDRRTGETIMDGYQRANPPQGNINVNYHNPIIHNPYGPLQSNCIQNNIFPYPSENSPKAVTINKLPYTNNSKIYADYEILQNKKISMTETVYANDVNHIHSMKGEVAYHNYAPVNVHGIPQHTIYRRENISLQNFEHMPHLKNLDHPVNLRNQFLRHPVHFSPNSIAISPSDSNTSNDASQTHSSSQEDCGYVSQSSTASGRSIDLHINGIPNEHHMYRSPDRYGFLSKNIQKQNPNPKNSKVKKDINVRQFLQMWNEGDDELGEQSKEENIAKDSNNLSCLPSQYESAHKQEQLYVLGLVNVPSEELDKYDHIQKISKLPENIKGYNNIELLNQFEEVIESSNMRSISKTQRLPISKPLVKTIPRPVSPLDVEAKISQSVIHKEVGCNFEIKPCSPKMLNVEIATPVKNILQERTIEKVSNPITAQTVTVPKIDKINIENSNFSTSGSVVINNNCGKTLNESTAAPSCNMDGLKYTNDNSLDLEYNSSVCLASLPRLDNEIELNFPEINQQFINANKIESLTPIAFKESSNLDTGQLNRHIQQTGQITELAKCSPNRESDKEFTKLSKYRKLKKTELDQNEMQNKSIVQDPINQTQFRTDSVIIKNPENVRQLEVNLSHPIVHNANNNTILNNTPNEINQNDNFASNVIKDVSVNARSPSTFNTKDNSFDTENAIDFSLNKNDNGIQNISPKETIANESFLNFIEENLNIPESYEKTKSPINENNHEFSMKVGVTKDANENNSIVSPSNRERECEKNKNDDILSNSDFGKTNKEVNKPIQLELNYSTNSEFIPTDIEIAGQNSLPTILHNLNESSISSSENKTPELRLQAEDNSKSLTELANTDNSKSLTELANTDNYETLTEVANTNNSKSLTELANTDNYKSLTELANTDNFKSLTELANTDNSKSLTELENTDNSESLPELANIDNSKSLTELENTDNSESLPELANTDNSKSLTELENTDNSESLPELANTDNSKSLTEFANTDNSESLTDLANTDHSKSLTELANTDHSKFLRELANTDNSKSLTELANTYNSKSLTELGNSGDEMMNENEIHTDNYPIRGNDFESNKIDRKNIEIDLNEVTNANCQIFHEESHLDSLNIEPTNNFDFECKNSEKSLESIIDINVQTFEEGVKIDCEYKTYEEKNFVPKYNIDRYKNVIEKKFNKRLFSPVILNLINYNDEKPKEKNPSQKITPDVTPNVENTKINNCIDQSINLVTDHSVRLECETLSTEITGCVESLETSVESTEKSLVTKQYSIEYSERLSPNNMGSINEESCPSTNNKCTINDSRNPCCGSENETTGIETNTNYNSSNDCPEKLDTSNEECRHSTIADNKMLPSNQIGAGEEEEKKLDHFSFKEITNTDEQLHSKLSVRLKRSLSDSALNIYANEEHKNAGAYYNIPKKRKRINPCEMMEPKVIAQNLCNIIQTNRRNSISTVYNEESVSFCILIDNSCDLIAENACTQKITLAEITEDEFEDEFKEKFTMSTENIVITDDLSNKITCSLIEDYDTNSKIEIKATQSSPENVFISDYATSERNEDNSYDETWIEDVACIETVFSDDITEDIVLGPPSTPKHNHEPERKSESGVQNESVIYNDIDHINKMKYIYGNEMCNDDVDLVETLYRTPQMDLKKTLSRRESQYSDETTRYYDNDSLEKILSESNYKEVTSDSESGKLKTNIACSDTIQLKNEQDDKENLKYELPLQTSFSYTPGYLDPDCYDKQRKSLESNMREPTQYDIVHSCESTCDYTSSYKNTGDSPRYSNSSSPEVSSTTSEEKGCGILLKITNCNGSISSQLNDCNTKHTNKSISESTEKKELINLNCNPTRSRPLITKAAQKYIPPLRETIPDLKVKLPLPKHSLNKLKILKISKDKPKLDKSVNNKSHISPQPHYPKKSKPKFEDVLKSIDEIHIKKHKEKNKKQKHSIPKVVIKKNENGAHYTSTSNDVESYNPDLTGRKWQPWVFIEKNYFIDKMALNKKAKAVFNYRKNTYVLAEKFRKYKSVHNAKFVISQPKMEDISSGKLKYTIRLKHNY